MKIPLIRTCSRSSFVVACSLIACFGGDVPAQSGRRAEVGSPASQEITVPLPSPDETGWTRRANTPGYQPTPKEETEEKNAAEDCGATLIDEATVEDMIRRGEALRRKDVTTPAQILRKPPPGYTKAARRNGVSGTVRLRLVLSAEGKVSHVEILDRLPYGLTLQSIRAACAMRFHPATKDGQPVAQVVMVMYGFQIHDNYPPIMRPTF